MIKIAFITTYYRQDELKEIDRVSKEIKALNLSDCSIYKSDCTNDNRGYSAGINKGIKKALQDGTDLFIIFNPDISIKSLKVKDLLELNKRFDIWGFANRQQGTAFYGGEIDKWRMSGGLVSRKPYSRYAPVDFVSGSFIGIKRKVIEQVGLWEESYFLYYDEVDYCHRAKLAGFRLGIDASKSYDHYEISNTQNPKKEFFLAKSRLLFLNKYGSSKQKLYELARLPKTIFEYRNMVLRYVILNTFLKNFFSMNISSLLIKCTNFINFFFLVRYLTAPEYGIYTLVWAQVTLLTPLVDLGTTSYGVVYLPTAKQKVQNALLNFRIFLSVFIFVLTILLSLMVFKGSTKIYTYIIITATVIFTNVFSGSYFILTAIKNKLYMSSRNALLFNIFLVAAIAVSLVLWRRLLIVFAIIFIFYNAYTLLNILLIKRELRTYTFKFDPRIWWQILKKAYIFVLISFFAGLYFKLDVFLLKSLKGETEVGIYSAGYKFFEALLFIAVSYNVTAAPILARLTGNPALLKRKITKDAIFLLAIGISTAVFVYLGAPLLMPYIFSKNYIPSVPVLQIVIFSLPLVLLNSIWINILYVLQKAYLVIFVFLFQTVANLSLNIIFIPKYSYIASSVITVFSELLNFMVLALITLHVWRKYRPQIKT